jgi:putative restriction endonuclease
MSIFGEIVGVPEGTTFESREAVRKAGLHRHGIAGISGAADEGADAIALAGGYEDDQDFGDVVIYTSEGGNEGRKQVADQAFTKGNKALALNKSLGLPVRVIRGHRHKSPYSPKSGYRYDGLFAVDDYWHEKGQSGYTVWRYRLRKLKTGEGLGPDATEGKTEAKGPAPKKTAVVSRIIRDTAITRQIKMVHDYRCQVCNERLEGPAGPYAEGAHIKPLGTPHNGPDEESNVLCLCPNHHALFDMGGFTVNQDLTFNGIAGKLRTATLHKINVDHLEYHRSRYGKPS